MTLKSDYFDNVPSRKGSGSYKWDCRPGVLPLWVADMDFPTAPCIIEALSKRAAHGIFGYTFVGDDYYDALCRWFAERHAYTIDREMVIYTIGVVPALSAIIKALAKEGEGVVVQTPVYNCFFSSIRNNGCRVVENPLLRHDLPDGTFTYTMDLEALDRICADPSVTLMLLCNPANPAARLWTRQELEEVCRITARHGVRVVSDEIHCELTPPATSYTPYGTIDKSAIICVSPSKAFNTAGLQLANIVCPDAATRALIDRAININEVCDVNPFGVEALKAAYSPEGAEWLDALRSYLYANYQFAHQQLRKHLPQCPVGLLEASYLVWLDITPLGLTGDEAEELLIEHAGVWINSGHMYGDNRYIRINLACPRARLADGLDRICKTLASR